MPNETDVKIYLKTILVIFLMGSVDGLINLLIDPSTFNFTSASGLQNLLTSIVIKGALAAKLYMLKSPYNTLTQDLQEKGLTKEHPIDQERINKHDGTT